MAAAGASEWMQLMHDDDDDDDDDGTKLCEACRSFELAEWWQCIVFQA